MSEILGAGNVFSPEMAIQEALLAGLGRLAENLGALEHLVARSDSLRLGTGRTWTKDAIEALRDMADPRSDRFVQVLPGMPMKTAQLPCWGIVLDGGGDNLGEAVMGDILSVRYEKRGPPTEPAVGIPAPGSTEKTKIPNLYKITTYGIGQTHTVQVSSWAVEPQRAFILHAAARWALHERRGLLTRQGIHEIVLNESGFAQSPDLEPRVGYVPVISARISWTWTREVAELAPNRIRFLTPSYSSG